MCLWISGGAGVFLICVSTAHRFFSDGPIFAAAIKHLNNSKSFRLRIDSIELTRGLVIFASVVMPTTLLTRTPDSTERSCDELSSGGRFNSGKAIFFTLSYVLRDNFKHDDLFLNARSNFMAV